MSFREHSRLPFFLSIFSKAYREKIQYIIMMFFSISFEVIAMIATRSLGQNRMNKKCYNILQCVATSLVSIRYGSSKT